MVRVFTYQAQPRGHSPQQIAAKAFAFNGHPADAEGAALAGEYYQRPVALAVLPREPALLRLVLLQDVHVAVAPGFTLWEGDVDALSAKLS